MQLISFKVRINVQGQGKSEIYYFVFIPVATVLLADRCICNAMIKFKGENINKLNIAQHFMPIFYLVKYQASVTGLT